MTDLFAAIELNAEEVASSIAASHQLSFSTNHGESCLNLFRQIRDYIFENENFGVAMPKKFKDDVVLALFKILR